MIPAARRPRRGTARSGAAPAVAWAGGMGKNAGVRNRGTAQSFLREEGTGNLVSASPPAARDTRPEPPGPMTAR